MTHIDNEQRHKWYKKFSNRVLKWIKLHGGESEYLSEAIAYLKKDLEVHNRGTRGIPAISNVTLTQLYTYYGVSASHCLIKDKECFSRNLVLGYKYLLANVRQVYSAYVESGEFSAIGISVNDFFDCLCLAIILEDKVNYTWLHGFYKELFERGILKEEGSLDVPYGKYVVALGDVLNGHDPHTIENIHPSFDGLFQNWEDTNNNLSQSILDALDYHLLSDGNYRVHQKEHEKMYPEYIYAQGFLSETVIVFPLEILAYYRIREIMGLQTPKVEHSLMDHNVLERALSIHDLSATDGFVDLINT